MILPPWVRVSVASPDSFRKLALEPLPRPPAGESVKFLMSRFFKIEATTEQI